MKEQSTHLEIPRYILIKDKGLSWYYYLHIQGGTGSKDGLGGQYSYYLYYCRPEQICDKDAAVWCKENDLPCGTGDTIEQAYADFLTKKHLLK